MSGIAINKNAQGRLREREKLKAVQWQSDFLELMKAPEFRRFLWTLIDSRCNSHGMAISWSEPEMFWLQGQRQIGVDLREEAKRLAPIQYAQMLSEFMCEQEEKIHQQAMESAIEDDDE